MWVTRGGISSVILRSVMSIMWHNYVNDVNMFYILGIRHPVSSKLMGYKVPPSPKYDLFTSWYFGFINNAKINLTHIFSGKPLLLSPSSMYRNYNYGNFNRNFFSGYKNKNYYDDYVHFHDKYNFGLWSDVLLWNISRQCAID